MGRKILVINGNPDPSTARFSAALAEAYVRGASLAGHQIRRIDVGSLDFQILRSQSEFTQTAQPCDIREAQHSVGWADHLVIIFPLWLGGAPALLKGFFEQVFRYGFALTPPGETPKGLLVGRSARLIVTMGMPGAVFRLVFGAFGVRALERGVLWLSGIRPIRHTIIGGVDDSVRGRLDWLNAMQKLGRSGA